MDPAGSITTNLLMEMNIFWLKFGSRVCLYSGMPPHSIKPSVGQILANVIIDVLIRAHTKKALRERERKREVFGGQFQAELITIPKPFGLIYALHKKLEICNANITTLEK